MRSTNLTALGVTTYADLMDAQVRCTTCSDMLRRQKQRWSAHKRSEPHAPALFVYKRSASYLRQLHTRMTGHCGYIVAVRNGAVDSARHDCNCLAMCR